MEPSARTRSSIALLALVSLATPSCFAYDSRWGETKRAQQSVAQHATPRGLSATPDGDDPAPGRLVRMLKVRVHATPRYAGEVLDWPRRLEDLVRDANAVLEPTLAARLEVVSTDSWAPKAGEEDLSALVDELAAADPGKDVDRVVALVGSVPRYELSFHQLGVGKIMGKHLAMRTTNDAREYEAIRRGFGQLEENERTKLYASRKRHKATTLFLHELGHTFGVPHEVEGQALMHATYDWRVEGFSPAAAQLMRISLAHETEPGAQSPSVFSRALIEHLQRTAEGWVAKDRDEMIERLERTPPPQPAKPPPPKVSAKTTPPGSLSAADRAIYDEAQAHVSAGRLAEASTTAAPLFTAYPGDFAVQELRCQIAMKRGGDWNAIQSECDRLLKLVPGGR